MTTAAEAGAKSGLRAGIALGSFVVIVGLVYFLADDRDLWFKAFHIMAVIAWMAGLFYLPRLFIYHADAAVGSEKSETFKVMETKLYRIIMNPSMMLSWLLGLYLAWPYFQAGGNGWLHAKLTAVVVMTVLHVYLGRTTKAFARDERPGSQRRWRIINEIPAVLMIAIVLLVILKPF